MNVSPKNSSYLLKSEFKILETETKNPQKNLIREGVFLNVIQNE